VRKNPATEVVGFFYGGRERSLGCGPTGQKSESCVLAFSGDGVFWTFISLVSVQVRRGWSVSQMPESCVYAFSINGLF